MKNRRLPGALALAIVLIATSAHAQDATPPEASTTAPAAPRPSLTVADFDTDRTGWMPPPRLGSTLAELLTDRLVNTGRLRIVAREWVANAENETMRIPYDVLLDRAAGAGVDYLVTGAVTRFSNETKSSTTGGIVPLPFIGGLFRKSKTESVIGLTLRVIDVRTGEVVATATATSGAAEQSSVKGGGVAVVGHVPVPLVAGKGTSVTGFRDRLLDQAAQEAVSAAAEQILAAAPRLVRISGEIR